MPECPDEARNGASPVNGQLGQTCPSCGKPLYEGDVWPARVFVPCQDGTRRLWHFWCAFEKSPYRKIDQPLTKRRCLEAKSDFRSNDFHDALEELVTLSPDVRKRTGPRISICSEEVSLLRAAEGDWSPARIPTLHPIAYQFQGLTELRISACSALRSIPPEVGQLYGLISLVFISDGLTELPQEIGNLDKLEYLFLNCNFLKSVPKPVCELPNLKEICLDANLIEKLPPITSPYLQLFTVPANRLEEIPDICPEVKRIEAHGNRLTTLNLSLQTWPGLLNKWGHMQTLKLVGNHLKTLPPEVCCMHGLKTLLVASNKLQSLPQGLVKLQQLQWLYAYDNAISGVPEGLMTSCSSLDRILLEGNPLTAATVEALFRDAPCSQVKTLGLDMDQVDRCFVNKPDGCSHLPACVKLGCLVGIGGPGENYYMKRVLWSQLADSNAAHAPGSSSQQLADNLVVAFSASQAEPEWLGVLSRIARSKCVEPLAPPKSSLADFFREKQEDYATGDSLSIDEREASIAALWSMANPTWRRNGELTAQQDIEKENSPFPFDVLTLVDHCMSWYAADPEGLGKALASVTQSYKRVVFVGASMGGFGAILHGGRLADAVVAFGPQSKLIEAQLRPRAQGLGTLQALSADLKESVRIARDRGASVKVHCAIDDHFWHALQLPLEAFALTVHPLCPMKPFARLLDRCNVLLPIISDACFAVLRSPAASKCAQTLRPFQNLESCGGLLGAEASRETLILPSEDTQPKLVENGFSSQIGIACWHRSGGFTRFSTDAKELVRLFYAEPAPYAPRPGQWYCWKCKWRNATCRFYCKFCAEITEAGHITGPTVLSGVRVSDGRQFPRKGDWGCGKCGEALFNSEASCSRCGTLHDDGCNFLVY